jgi:hypothetical protein
MAKLLSLLVGLLCLTSALGKVRRYYVAALEKSWDYAPTGLNNFDGTSISSGDAGVTHTHLFLANLQPLHSLSTSVFRFCLTIGDCAVMTGVFGANAPGSRVGTQYKKALYVEFTDATFTTKKPQPAWQGNLGPTLRAEVHEPFQV